jgi:FAD/FMN-containing dehydrogenase
MMKDLSFQDKSVPDVYSLEKDNLAELKKNISGNVIFPQDSDYLKLNEKIIKKGNPAAVVQPLNADDICEVVNYARKNKVILSIFSGGHGLPGFCTNEGGIVIDLSHINDVTIKDADKNIVRIGSGAKWGDVALKLQPYKLAISSGDTKSVGVGGLTQGGGIGWMVRKYGLTIDSLAGAEVVTADGKIIYTSLTENPELFWGIRGGGSSFCVVVYFDFIAQPLDKITAGTIQYNMEELSQVIKNWRDYMRTAAEELTTSFRLLPPLFGNPAAAMLLFCYAGTGTEAEAAANALCGLGKVITRDIKQMNYADFLEEPMAPPPTIKMLFKNIYAENFSDVMIENIIAQTGKAESPVIQIRGLGGIMHRIQPDSTAYVFRNAEVLVGAAVLLPVNASKEQETEATKFWDDISRHGRGAYISFLAEGDLKEIFPEPAYSRLAEAKRLYDPENVFNRSFSFD